MQNIHFVSGLPRSGSTLFQQIIGQNPNFHPTPTSGFINFFMGSKRCWKTNNEFNAEGLDKVNKRVNSSFRGMFEGYYRDELESGKIVFEKSRGWMAYIPYLKEIFQNDDIKIICMVRDVRAILASFEKLYRNRGIEYTEVSEEDFVLSQTVEGRCDIHLKQNGVVGLPITRLINALRCHPKNIILVPYKQLIHEPKKLFSNLHDMLELPKFEYDFCNVKQITNENDVFHGYKDLHKIKEGSIVPPENEIPWKGIINEQYCNMLQEKYSFINDLANNV